jgi:arginine utilization protein RocB
VLWDSVTASRGASLDLSALLKASGEEAGAFFNTLGSEMSKRAVSDEFDATEKAAMEAALNRCRALARRIKRRLRNKRAEHFVDKLSLADFYASLARAADVLEKKSRKSVENKRASAVKGSQARGRQCHR